jgi:hypothetical protein
MKEGVTLLGIVMPNGRVAFSPDRIEVNREFVANAREGRSPEKRFRFADACVRAACKQWTGTRCGVIDEVLNDMPAHPLQAGSQLPHCSIRFQCRWYEQAGAEACRACTLVITDCRMDEAMELAAT